MYGYPGNNASTLAYQLPYSRTASTLPSQGNPNIPSQQPAGQGPSSGSPSTGNGAPGGLENGSSGSPVAGSGNAGGSPGICPLQSTVTITTQYTVTVTQAAAVATTAGPAGLLQKGSTVNGSTGPGSLAQNGSGNGSNGSANPWKMASLQAAQLVLNVRSAAKQMPLVRPLQVHLPFWEVSTAMARFKVQSTPLLRTLLHLWAQVRAATLLCPA